MTSNEPIIERFCNFVSNGSCIPNGNELHSNGWIHLYGRAENVAISPLSLALCCSTIAVTLRSTQQTAPLRNDERNVNSENERNGEKESVNGEKRANRTPLRFFSHSTENEFIHRCINQNRYGYSCVPSNFN